MPIKPFAIFICKFLMWYLPTTKFKTYFVNKKINELLARGLPYSKSANIPNINI